MIELRVDIDGEERTRELGRKLAALVRPGDVVGLCGDLGAGKTCLAAATALALGVGDGAGVSSPTFAIVNEYRGGRLPVFHMDFYRLAGPDDLYGLGIWEYYEGDGVCLVEWCDRFPDLWPEDALVVTIELREGERRRIVLSGTGRGAELASGLAGVSPSR
ncbi:MAG TPA: tRNA (adenosine(37)-N6)-threonylcarbamoyltransferase complex ATPase subunit type 1 TsaE [Polyangia bacterium]|nr:tRNA (adenosine(37)-N6)-threonylcarbamoyltransferase complex ATPase subunit type 1 TsaE [Polyangia bacterium]